MSKGVKYWGKYRGTVVNNADPQQIGRLLVEVPDVGGLSPNSWAMPCLPMTGKQAGVWVLPQVGNGVWVEFEHGDTNRNASNRCRWVDGDSVAGALERHGNLHVLLDGNWFAHNHGNVFGQLDVCRLHRISHRDGDCGSFENNGSGCHNDACTRDK